MPGQVSQPLHHSHPAGTPVHVVMDDQTIVQTWTRSETWTARGQQIVLLEGREAGYLVKRCSVDEERNPK